MKKFTGAARILESGRELIPDFSEEFPYVASLARIDRFPGGVVPWHWHDSVELFYMESGCLEYETPGRKLRFPAGTGGLVNAGVLHTTRSMREGENADETVQLLHIFDPAFIAGAERGVIAQRYVRPVVLREDIEIVPIFPETPEREKLLELLRGSFDLSESEAGYELRLRAVLSELWLGLLEWLPAPRQTDFHLRSDRLRHMMRYVQEHYAEKISVAALAASALTSERECYRLFREYLHCPPTDYIMSFRLDAAGRLLRSGDESITEISQSCGFGSSSYFGRVFLQRFQCTPSQYRRRWRNSEKIMHE